MTNDFSTPPAASLPTRARAFVVHLAPAGAGPEGSANGRVEHVATGRAARFGSGDDLLRFMRDTLAAVRDAGR